MKPIDLSLPVLHKYTFYLTSSSHAFSNLGRELETTFYPLPHHIIQGHASDQRRWLQSP